MTLNLLQQQIDDVQASKAYQIELSALYAVIAKHQYTSMSVLIDPNAHGKSRLDILDSKDLLRPQPIKKIHHTFAHELELIQIPLETSYGQQWMERLLALAILENQQDQFRQPCARSVCFWMFDKPITDSLKHSLYLMGQAIDNGNKKRRYLRYWDPRVLSLLGYIWTDMLKLWIYRLEISRIYYVDWNNEMKFENFIPNQPLSREQIQLMDKSVKQPPFHFSCEQWGVLKQVEWINTMIMQHKAHMRIDNQVYQLLLAQAKAIATRQVSQQQALSTINNELKRASLKGARCEQ